MNESNQNVRTLIVSFVIAIFTLIPLRFIEVGQMNSSDEGSQVLGVQHMAEVLPKTVSVLEAPYDEIDKVQANCLSQSVANGLKNDRETMLSQGSLDRVTVDRVVGEMMQIDANTCK